jgi:hypothetical protein
LNSISAFLSTLQPKHSKAPNLWGRIFPGQVPKVKKHSQVFKVPNLWGRIFPGQVPKVEKHLGILKHHGRKKGGALQLWVDGESTAQIHAVFGESDL